MESFNSSPDSLLCFSSSSPTDEMHFVEDIQAMLESLDGDDNNEMEINPTTGKKRRLSLVQVRALEKHFEEDYKLEPDRKSKLAIELGLQPRQVSVWFQNRRARWKNKQLEKDYEVLKSSYDELKKRYENVGREREVLNAELKNLKLKLGEVSESESNNRNNVVNQTDHEPWSCSSSSFMHLDSSMSYLPEDLSWFQCGNGVAGAECGPTGPSWFNCEVDYWRENST